MIGFSFSTVIGNDSLDRNSTDQTGKVLGKILSLFEI